MDSRGRRFGNLCRPVLELEAGSPAGLLLVGLFRPWPYISLVSVLDYVSTSPRNKSYKSGISRQSDWSMHLMDFVKCHRFRGHLITSL